MERSTFEMMHEEIKRRAYQLIERKDTVVDGSGVEDELNGELPRIVYALSSVQECTNGETDNSRIHRAARIYLRALSSFVAERCRQNEANASVRDATKT